MYLNRYCSLLIIKRTGFVKPNVEFCAAVYYGKLKQTIPSFNEERKASSPRGRAARTSRTETLSITQIGHRSLRAAAARAPRRVGSSRAQLAECSGRRARVLKAKHYENVIRQNFPEDCRGWGGLPSLCKVTTTFKMELIIKFI